MPRVRRLVVPHYPHHIVHRGHNCQPIFAERTDYESYFARLRQLRVRCKGLRLLSDDESCAPLAGSPRSHGHRRAHEAARGSSHAASGRPRGAKRHTLGRSLQIEPRAARGLLSGTLSIHRAESSSRADGRRTRGLRLVELSLPRRARHRGRARPRSRLVALGTTQRERRVRYCLLASGDSERRVAADPRGCPTRAAHRERPVHRRSVCDHRTPLGSTRPRKTKA